MASHRKLHVEEIGRAIIETTDSHPLGYSEAEIAPDYVGREFFYEVCRDRRCDWSTRYSFVPDQQMVNEALAIIPRLREEIASY